MHSTHHSGDMTTNTETQDIYTEAKQLTGLAYITSVGLRLPSGKALVLAKLERHQLVDCSDYSAALASIDSLISMAMYAGIAIDRTSACAAVWSVPDGAPLEMALDNLGCELYAAAADKMEQWAAERRASARAYRSGPR